ncbi:unnamed protein product, partial [Darwinula stevensoni]
LACQELRGQDVDSLELSPVSTQQGSPQVLKLALNAACVASSDAGALDCIACLERKLVGNWTQGEDSWATADKINAQGIVEAEKYCASQNSSFFAPQFQSCIDNTTLSSPPTANETTTIIKCLMSRAKLSIDFNCAVKNGLNGIDPSTATEATLLAYRNCKMEKWRIATDVTSLTLPNEEEMLSLIYVQKVNLLKTVTQQVGMEAGGVAPAPSAGDLGLLPPDNSLLGNSKISQTQLDNAMKFLKDLASEHGVSVNQIINADASVRQAIDQGPHAVVSRGFGSDSLSHTGCSQAHYFEITSSRLWVEGVPRSTEILVNGAKRLQQLAPAVGGSSNEVSDKNSLIEKMISAKDLEDEESEEKRSKTQKFKSGIFLRSGIDGNLVIDQVLVQDSLNMFRGENELAETSSRGSHLLQEHPLLSQGQSNRCNSTPPWLGKMTKGIDITELDMTPFDFAFPDGFKLPLFDFTCEQGNKIVLNQTYVLHYESSPQTEYQLPDQIWAMTPVPGGWFSSNVEIFKSYQEVKRSRSTEVGAKGGIFGFGFSASRSYMYMQDTITNHSRYIEEVSAFETAVRADLHPSWIIQMSKMIDKFVEGRLQKNFTEDPGAYEEFIDNFGTHYFKTARFGGFIKLLLETKSEYFKNVTDEQVKTEAGASFLKLLSLKRSIFADTTKLDARFEQMTRKTIRKWYEGLAPSPVLIGPGTQRLLVVSSELEDSSQSKMYDSRQAWSTAVYQHMLPQVYYGGDVKFNSTNNTLQDWQPTVSKKPWLFSGELEPISDLLQEESKRNSMEQAVMNHVLHAYVDELARIVKAVPPHWPVGLKKLMSLQDEIASLQSIRILEETKVKQVAAAVEDQVEIPAWFTRWVRLCFRWESNGPGECYAHGGVQQLCANPGMMTADFTDSTKSGKGCNMTWGILSEFEPDWFKEVRFCFRWSSCGDWSQPNWQTCGRDIDPPICAPVNNWTQVYLDNSSNSKTFRVSWSLLVPNTAPIWLHNIKLCFRGDGYWDPMGKPNREACAIANEWTPYRHDVSSPGYNSFILNWSLKME